MKSQDTEKYRGMLLQQNQMLPVLSGGNVDMRSESGKDPADLAFQSEEAGDEILVLEKSNRVHLRIQSALEKIRAGLFGICEICDKSIPKTRLDAIPYVECCKQHQDEFDAGRHKQKSLAGSCDWSLVSDDEPPSEASDLQPIETE